MIGYQCLWITVLIFIACTNSHMKNYEGEEYSNRWVIKVPNGEQTARKVAAEHGYQFVGKVFDDYYSVKHNRVSKRSAEPNVVLHQRLQDDVRVEEAQQQVAKDMVSKETIPITDPEFEKQWYLKNPEEENWDHKVTKAWEHCLTGSPVTIAIVDDGIRAEHPDISNNYRARKSFNAVGWNRKAIHGTKCASVAAGVKNNICGTGVAFNAKLSDVTVLGGVFTDDKESTGFFNTIDKVDIYSCSYGPGDTGYTLGKMGDLARKAIERGALQGREGKGNIFVWSAGNGGISQDSCAYDEYVNNIYSISVSSWSKYNQPLRGSEQCSAIMVVASSKDKGDRSVPMVAAEGRKGCTEEFSGSSASTPIVSGAIALALEARPDLTRRDVQYLIVYSSNSDIPYRGEQEGAIQKRNGLKVSPLWGFGLLDAEKLVVMAKQWKPVSGQISCNISFQINDKSFIPSEGQDFIEDVYWYSNQKCRIQSVEHVELHVDATYCVRGFLKAEVISPDGTNSVILPGRINDRRTTEVNWRAMSVHFWGERSEGSWRIKLSNMNKRNARSCTGTVRSLSLKLYGTEKEFILEEHLDRTVDITPRCKVEIQSRDLDEPKQTNFRIETSVIEMNLTVVENSTANLPFLITPSNINEKDYARLTWWKTLQSSHNVMALYILTGSGPIRKWHGEFNNTGKASINEVTGTLSIHRAQVSDTDRYYFDVTPRAHHVKTNVVINLKVIKGEQNCVNEFETFAEGITLRLNPSQFTKHPFDIDLEECRQKCFQFNQCRSMTMIKKPWKTKGRCQLNYVKWGDAGVESEVKEDAEYFGRLCVVETIQTTPALERWPVHTQSTQPTPLVVVASRVCRNTFYHERPNLVLRVQERDSLHQLTNIYDLYECKSRCLRYDDCRSVTYQQSQRKCYLNKVNNRDDGTDTQVVAAHLSMTLVERDCSGLVTTTERTTTTTTASPTKRYHSKRRASIECGYYMNSKVYNRALRVTNHDIIGTVYVNSVEICKSYCRDNHRCRAVIYERSTGRCTLSKVNNQNDGARDEYKYGTILVENRCYEHVTTTTAATTTYNPYRRAESCRSGREYYGYRLKGALRYPDGDNINKEDCIRMCCDDKLCKSVSYKYSRYDRSSSSWKMRCWKHQKKVSELNLEGRTTSSNDGYYRMVDITLTNF